MLPTFGREHKTSLPEAKNKKNFPDFHPMRLFTHRDLPDTNTKWTRTPSVIYPPLAEQTKTHINEKQHHNAVFFNTTAWDSHPHASIEGLGTALSEKC